jgi:hypothetical protein
MATKASAKQASAAKNLMSKNLCLSIIWECADFVN